MFYTLSSPWHIILCSIQVYTSFVHYPIFIKEDFYIVYIMNNIPIHGQNCYTVATKTTPSLHTKTQSVC